MKRISKAKAEQLVSKGAFLVDMRSPVSFRDGHVSGAVNLPLRNFVNKIMSMDKKTRLIIYSDDVTDDVLRQGNNYAENLGFTEIFIADYHSLITDTTANHKPSKPVKNSRNRRF